MKYRTHYISVRTGAQDEQLVCYQGKSVYIFLGLNARNLVLILSKFHQIDVEPIVCALQSQMRYGPFEGSWNVT